MQAEIQFGVVHCETLFGGVKCVSLVLRNVNSSPVLCTLKIDFGVVQSKTQLWYCTNLHLLGVHAHGCMTNSSNSQSRSSTSVWTWILQHFLSSRTTIPSGYWYMWFRPGRKVARQT